MSFLSVRFLGFLAVVFAAYFLLPKRWQPEVLLGANIVFYLSAGVEYAGFILVTCVSAYWVAIFLERTTEAYKKLRKNCQTREEKQANKQESVRKKTKILAAGLLLNFGVWILLKYTGFFLGNVGAVLGALGLSGAVTIPSFVLPLGISFYTFMAMGYCIDIYRGKYPAEKNFGRFLLFISFFPHLVQGPFSRYDRMRDTLYAGHDFSFDRLGEGLVRMLWGFFKKMVVADRLGIVVGQLYATAGNDGGVFVLVLMVLARLRLYADFSGYMDIAAGICRVLGVSLQENFAQPFFARSIEEVWRRWHITLGEWFRDYVFYPISMSGMAQKLGKRCRGVFSPATARLLPSYVAMAVVWTATGLWHGATWYYVLWGWMNMGIIVLGMQLAPLYAKGKQALKISDENRIWRAVQMGRTFLIFCYMEMFSGAGSTKAALGLTAALFRGHAGSVSFGLSAFFPGLGGFSLCVVFVGLALMWVADIRKEKGQSLGELLQSIPMPIRYLGYAALFYAILLLGNTGADLTGGFMYAQF